jgi:flagellar biosynthesis protein FliR
MINILTQEAAITFILVLSRISGVMISSPILSSRSVPSKLKILLAFIISLMIFPAISMVETIPASMPRLLVAVFNQVAFGLLVGLVISMVFAAIQAAGGFMDMQIGFGMSSLIDPATGVQATIVSRWFSMITLILFLGINGHHWLFLGLINSFKAASLEQSLITPGLINYTIKAFTDIYVIGFNIAAPVLMSILLVDITAGFIGKTAPKLNIMFIAFPFKVAMGYFMIFLSLSSLLFIFANILGDLRGPLLKMFYL